MGFSKEQIESHIAGIKKKLKNETEVCSLAKLAS